MGKTTLKNITNQDGFTLIDVAIALMVIGLLTAPLIAQYNDYQHRAEASNMNGNFNSANDAIRQFYFENNRYPCPADPTLNVTDANYGEENCTGAAPIIAAPATDVDGIAGIDNIWIGALPFKALRMTPKEALDPWNNKINYAISDLLAVPTLNNPIAVFNPGYGMVTIRREESVIADICDGVPVVVPNIHYALYSNGRDSIGAYNAEGIQGQACPAAGATLDEENCNNDIIFRAPTCRVSNVAGANHYDDWFYGGNMQPEMTQSPTKMWTPGTNPTDSGTDVGYIGLANNNPQSELDVIGNIRAENDATDPTKSGQAHASDYCDTTGGNCFQPNVIAGNDPTMRCTNSQGMAGIGSNQARCTDVLTSVPAHSCPSGQYISGISPAGVVTCATP